MLIPVVRWPGAWIDGLTDLQAHEAQGQLRLMQGGLDEAAVTLHLFEAAQHEEFSEPRGPEAWQARLAERAAVEKELRALAPTVAVGTEGWWEQEEALRSEVDHETNRRAWLSGRWPISYRHRLPFLYARSFLYSLDGLGKALGVLANQTWAPEGVSTAQATWTANFPHLNGVRNSSHHHEDRIRNLRTGNRQIELKPVDNELVSAPGGGVMILNALNGDRFGSTMADGHYGEVEVNANSLCTAADIHQQVLDAFDWHGPVEFHPGR